MPDYGMYQLSNSKEIPRFVGSSVPELTQASQVMQGRYDTALQYEDAIDQGIKQATSLGQDTKHLLELKEKYKGRLGERAKKGDYENMVRDTARDARDFVNEYKPIAQNQQLYAEYQKELKEKVDKGTVSPDRAAKMLDYSTRSYKGLQRDPLTGQLKNQFQGQAMVDDLDVPAWIDKQLIGLKETTTGRTIQKDINGFYIMEGNTRKQLDYKTQIKPIIDAAKASDPKYQAWVNQETLLNSYDAKYTPENAIKQSPLYPQLQQIADQQGVTLQQAYQLYKAQSKYSEIEKTVDLMGQKYQRNDHEYVWKNMGATEETAARIKARVEDENKITFAGLAKVSLPGMQYATPTDLASAKDLTQTAVTKLETGANDYLRLNGVTKNANGRYIDSKNMDVTDVVDKNNDMIAQARRTQQALESREKRIMEKAGFHPTEELIKDAKKAGQQAYNLLDRAIELSGDPKALREKRYKDAYARVLQNTDGYQRYAQLLKADAQNSTVEVPIQQFRSKAANTAMENMVTNLAQDLDIGGLKGGLLGMKNMDGSELTDKDYGAIKGDSKFGGWFIDPADGKYKVVFKVGKLGTKDGETVGTTRLVKMDAGQDVIQYLLGTGESHYFKQAVAQSLGDLETSPDKALDLALPGGKKETVSLRRVNPSGISTNEEYGNVKPQYEAVFRLADGTQQKYLYNTPGEVSSKLGTIVEEMQKDLQKK
jgi:hypothetical protein